MTPAPRYVLASRDTMLLEILEHAITDDTASTMGVGAASTVSAAITAAESAGARVAVLDMDLAPLPELQSAVVTLLAAGTRTLVIASYRHRAVAPMVLLAGASGLLYVEDAGLADIVSAVRDIDNGHTALHPSIANLVLNQWRTMRARDSAEEASDAAAPRAPLSPREHAVLQLVASGSTTRGIARSLGVAEKTVESHRARIYAKLGARNQAHAISLALSHGLLKSFPE